MKASFFISSAFSLGVLIGSLAMAMTATMAMTSSAHAAVPANEANDPISAPAGAANPKSFTANLDGLSQVQVGAAVQRAAAAACRQAYRGGDITKEYDGAGYRQCVQRTASSALDQIEAANASGQPMKKLTIAPQGPDRP